MSHDEARSQSHGSALSIISQRVKMKHHSWSSSESKRRIAQSATVSQKRECRIERQRVSAQNIPLMRSVTAMLDIAVRLC